MRSITNTTSFFIIGALMMIFLGFSNTAVAQDNIEEEATISSCGVPNATREQMEYIRNVVAQTAVSRGAASNFVPIQAHVVRRSDAKGGISQLELNIALSYLNYHFAKAGISFYWAAAPKFIDNSDFYNYNETDTDLDGADSEATLSGATTESKNAINIFFMNSITLAGGLVAGGYAYFPSNTMKSNRIMMTNGDAVTYHNGTFAHEMGHYFGLFHTHEGTEHGATSGNAENVSRTGEHANCSNTGDLICDTNADPRFSTKYYNFNTCSYTGDLKDAFGVRYTPPTDNIMSYYPRQCGGHFTSGQYSRIQQGMVTRKNYTTYTLDAKAVAVTTPDKLKLTFNAMSGTIVLTWNDRATNELGYVIERAEDGSAANFEVMPGAVTGIDETTYTDGFELKANTTYFYRVRATNGACDINSNAVSIKVGQLYCAPVASVSGANYIAKFKLNGAAAKVIDQNSINSSKAFMAYPTTGAVAAGMTFNFNMETKQQGNPSSTERFVTVWMDVNGDGDFDDEGEILYNEKTTNVIISDKFTVPMNAAAGNSRIRVRLATAQSIACIAATEGETEDYQVRVIAVAQSANNNPAEETVVIKTQIDNNGVALNWSNNPLSTNEYLVLERSDDDKAYRTLVNIAQRETTKNSYNDSHPLNGDNYYRLSKANAEGARTVIGKIVARYEIKENTLRLFPNPAILDMNVTYSAINNETATLEIFDQTGRLVQSNDAASVEGTNTAVVNVSELSEGVYFLRVTQGGVQVAQPFVKVK